VTPGSAAPQAGDLDLLVAAVAKTRKYSSLCPDLVRRLGSQELRKRQGLAQAVKATKNKLHQVAGAFLDSGMRYPRWLEQLEAAARTGGPAGQRAVCLKVLGLQSSTRERLEIMDEFYAAIFSRLPPVRSVLDLACGLNPLAIPWMPVEAGCAYYAYDVYLDMMDFIGRFLALAGIKGRAECRDILGLAAFPKTDLTLVLKSLPCLDQIEKDASLALLDKIESPFLVVSYPVHSLGRRDRDMPRNYRERFQGLVRGRGWQVAEIGFRSELVFLINR